MKMLALPFAALALAAAAGASPPRARTPGEIVAAAPAADWVTIAADDLIVMDLAPDRDGNGRCIVIQLIPPPFSEGWVGNIRTPAAAHWWDGTSVNRVQDNYVVQWGDANGEDKAKAKRLPSSVFNGLPQEYSMGISYACMSEPCKPGPVHERRMPFRDSYVAEVGFSSGWPVAGKIDEGSSTHDSEVWPVHCYGMVGVGRDMPPDTGTGAELYTVIGHAPRHLDRNIALVGRVIAGIEHLSSLPRGTGPLGFYEKPGQRVPIVSVRLGGEVAGLARYQFLSTESASFADYADARANRRDAFFIQPAGGADICNIPVPVRAEP